MKTYTENEDRPIAERLLTAEEVAELLQLSVRTILNLPIRQIRIGDRTI